MLGKVEIPTRDGKVKMEREQDGRSVMLAVERNVANGISGQTLYLGKEQMEHLIANAQVMVKNLK